MTPQEQYPKFFKHPHYWIDAIEVECVTPHAFYVNPHKYKPRAFEGEREMFTSAAYSEIKKHDTLKHFAPLFKPQEGEQFIKDLEVAVSAGLGEESVTLVRTQGANYVFEYEELFGVKAIEVYKTDLSILLPYGISFNCAAYVDKLRQLGYYV